MIANRPEIVEVGPRDGFQNIPTFIPTETKIELIHKLHAAGLRRIEIGSFVGKRAIPQMADTAEVLAATRNLSGFDPQVLVPSLRKAEEALKADAPHLAFVLSVSESHNMNNVRRTPEDSVREFAEICALTPASTKMRVNVATAFHCPFKGVIPIEQTLSLISALAAIRADIEFCLCDTTGNVTPDRVSKLFIKARQNHPEIAQWAFHGHDTYGLGVANSLAAWNCGISTIDASFAGLGGCPFAPGAAGNVATEDLVWTFHGMGIGTGIDLDQLLNAATVAAALPQACAAGRIRQAISATQSALQTDRHT